MEAKEHEKSQMEEVIRKENEGLKESNEKLLQEVQALRDQLAQLKANVAESSTKNAQTSLPSPSLLPSTTSQINSQDMSVTIPTTSISTQIPPISTNPMVSPIIYMPTSSQVPPASQEPNQFPPFPYALIGNSEEKKEYPSQGDPIQTNKDMEERSSDPNADLKRYQLLEERLRAIEGVDIFGSIDASDLCVVPGVVLPLKFKMPEFEKYNGTGCPRNHLSMFCSKMAAHIKDEKLLIYCFQESLSGVALRWYMGLKHPQIKKWKDLGDAFLKQYKHNIDMAPDRMQLQNMEMKKGEKFREYAQKWRDLAAQIIPPLTERELGSLFLDTLKEPYYDHCLSAVDDFSKLVAVGERVEHGIKHGKIQVAEESNNDRYKKGMGKRKEAEVHSISPQLPSYQPKPYYPRHPSQRPFYSQSLNYVDQQYHLPQPYQYRAPRPRGLYPANQSPAYQPLPFNPPRPANRIQNTLNTSLPSSSQTNTQRHFDPLPISQTEMYRQLFQQQQILPIPMKPMQPPFPKWYDVNAKCEYHAGAIGHSTENCIALKHRIQDLRDAGWLKITPTESQPNVNTNPLPNLTTTEARNVNIISTHFDKLQDINVDDLKTPLMVILKSLLAVNYVQLESQRGQISSSENDKELSCEFHSGEVGHSLEECDTFRRKVQNFLDRGIIRVEYRVKSKTQLIEETEVNGLFKIETVIPGVSPAKEIVLSTSSSPTSSTILEDSVSVHASTPSIDFPTPSIIVTIPKPFPFKTLKAVPWNYNISVDSGCNNENPPMEVDEIAGVSRITRTGRCYGPVESGK